MCRSRAASSSRRACSSPRASPSRPCRAARWAAARSAARPSGATTVRSIRRLAAVPPSPSSLTVVLPAYNEEQRLGPALDELFGYLRRRGPGRAGLPGPSELPPQLVVLVVDDGSSDGTADLVAQRPEIHAGEGEPVLRLLKVPHGGKGAAVKAGILASDTDLIIFTDADMATPPDQIPLLTDALRDHDVALGSRIQADGRDMRRSQPPYR